MLACDCFIAVTAPFRVIYVFPEVGTQRSIHWNVTAHPTADWTIEQFRMVITGRAAEPLFPRTGAQLSNFGLSTYNAGVCAVAAATIANHYLVGEIDQ